MGTSDYSAKSAAEKAQILAELRSSAQTDFEEEKNARDANAELQSQANAGANITLDYSKKTTEEDGTPPQPNSAQTAAPTIDYEIRSNILPNPLSEVENGTYNFKFFMTHELATHDSLSNESIIVIAETGSTGFNISDVEMDTIVSPSLASRNTLATNVKITIKEPFGTSLFDDIREAALALNVLDHRSAPMWLSVSFKGYTVAGENSHEGGEIKDLSDETRTWKLLVSNVDAEMTHGGTEYVFNCVAKSEQGLFDASRRLENMQPITATTLQDFFIELAEQLNNNDNYSTKTDISNIERIRKYAFSFPTGTSEYTDMLEWRLRGNTADGKKSEPILKNVDGKWQYTFSPGTSIESVIQEILSTTIEAQSLIIFGKKGGDVNNANVNTSEKDILIPSIAFMIEPIVDITSYNAVANDYNILINYHIVPYKTFVPIISRNHIEDAQQVEKSKERLKQLITISNMKKIYHYMFTGQNTEVLDFKIELNNTWFVGLPIYQGQARNSVATSSTNEDIKSPGAIVQQVGDTQQSIKQLEGNIAGLTEDIKTATDGKAAFRTADKISVLNDELQNVNHELADVDEKLYLDALDKRTKIPLDDTTNTFSFGASNRSLLIKNDIPKPAQRGVIKSSTIGATDLIQEVNARDARNSKGSIVYAEDLDVLNESLIDLAEQLTNKTIQGKLRSEISATSSQSEVGGEGTVGKGRAFFSTLMNQVYGFRGQLVEIDLEIRGDPYWLGIPDEKKRIDRLDPDRDLTNADAYFILTFGFPVSISDGGASESGDSFAGTGMYDITIKENGFNGIYKAISVSNSFSGGKFTQKINAVIDPLTQEQDIIDLVKENDIS